MLIENDADIAIFVTKYPSLTIDSVCLALMKSHYSIRNNYVL